MKDYKKIYRDATGLKWSGKDYHIHHLDGNHNNNDINNLLLIPARLHNQYHFYALDIQSLLRPMKPGFNVAISYWATTLRGYITTIEEMQKWMDFKYYCLGLIPVNIHDLSIGGKNGD